MTQPRHALEVLPLLLRGLVDARVRFGVYKNIDKLDQATRGEADFDILVEAGDMAAFHAVMQSLEAVRGTSHPLHDNSVTGREDWFVPDASGAALHLDVSFGLRVGPKYNKHYLALGHADVAEWRDHAVGGVQIPVASPLEAARIAILRAIFQLPSYSVSGWIRLNRASEALLAASALPGGGEHEFVYRVGQTTIACPVRRDGRRFEISASAVRELRAALRSASGFGAARKLLWQLADPALSAIRKTTFAIARRLSGRSPADNIAKRKLQPQGVIVALIGPDGVGKSTQSARLREIFGRKFRTGTVYLGSNDGSWMVWRGRLRKLLKPWRKTRSKRHSSGVRRASAPLTYRKVLGKSVWRLIIGLQRALALRKCRRLARRGVVVISDRWPQALRMGYMDGPSQRPPSHMKLPQWFWSIEIRMYRRMSRHRPDLCIHLDCDFATSNARKPGDTTEEAFELRLELMGEMRERDPDVKVVDVRQDRDAVTADLARLVWHAMHQAQRRPAESRTSRRGKAFVSWAACVSIGDAVPTITSIGAHFAT